MSNPGEQTDDETIARGRAIDAAMSALCDAIVDEQLARDRQHREVETLRELGVSWQAIGDELGMTRQGAAQRYGGYATSSSRSPAEQTGTPEQMPGTWPLWSGDRV